MLRNMDFWSTTLATAIGGCVAAIVGLAGVGATIWWQRHDAYRSRFDSALGDLFSSIRLQVATAEVGRFDARHIVPTSAQLLIDVDRAGLVAHVKGDRAVLNSVRFLIDAAPSRSAAWQIDKLSSLVDIVTDWRAGRLSTDKTCDRLDALSGE